jgi:hypothetical protein
LLGFDFVQNIHDFFPFPKKMALLSIRATS